MPTKIQLKRTTELNDDKRKALVAAEPLIDLTNNKVIIGKDGAENVGFALGDHSIAFSGATSPNITLTTPNTSSSINITGSNGITVTETNGELDIKNDADKNVEFANLTLNGGTESEGGQITLLHGDANNVDIIIDNVNDTFRIFGTNKDDQSLVGNMLILDPGDGTADHKPTISTPEGQAKYNFDGNSATATKFDSARKITLTGDVTGEVESDGELGWTINNTVVGDDSHNHTSSTLSLKDYSKGSSSDAITATDPLNDAIGKLEYKADNHTHGVTITPAGTITANANKGSTTASASKITGHLVASQGTAASYTPPTLTGSAPSISASITNKKMSITINDGSYSLNSGSFTPNTLPTLTDKTEVSKADHTHAVTVTHGAHTFIGTETSITTAKAN